MKKTLLLITLTVASIVSNAQNANNRWNIGAGIGFTDFVNPINKQFLMVERWKGGLNMNIARYLGKSFDGRLNVQTGNVFYPYANNQTGTQTVPTTFNLAQKGQMTYENSYMWDGGLNLVFKLANGSIMDENSTIAPYLFTGVGVNSITKIGSQGAGGNKGGAGSDQINPYIPVGFGLGMNLNDRWTAAAEYGLKFALGEAYNYANSAVRLGYNFGGGADAATAAAATAAAASSVSGSDEPAANANWCNAYNWKVGVGPTFNSFEAVQRAQNFMLDDYTTSLGINLTKYMNNNFDFRGNLGFGNVFYPIQHGAKQAFDGDNWNGTRGGTKYGAAQMIDLNLQAVFKLANGKIMPENAIFSPYVYAGPGLSYITSIGTWNKNQSGSGPKTYGTDDVNAHLGTGLGFNFRTSDKFAIQLEGARNWRLDNSYSYNQASLRGVYALGTCNGTAVKPIDKTTENTTPPSGDADNDGIPDLTDECPYVAGKAEFFGCPDSDNDGIGDSKDKCPFEAGVASNGGCPVKIADTDGDGVMDDQDKCVDVAGPASNGGCPEVKPNNGGGTSTGSGSTTGGSTSKSGTVVGNYELFFTGCSTLSPGQVETLQQIATMLRNNPNYKVELGGNVAKGGQKSCAQERANKVASMLKMKGVNVSNAKKSNYGSTRTKYGSDKDNRVDVQIMSFD